jgi:RHS repeat-associated protein
MSTYTYDTDTFRWSEAHIYGSSRIGIYNAEQVLVIGNTANSSTLQANEYENIRGKRHYELSEAFSRMYLTKKYNNEQLSNHLGNVLAVVSDRRTGICTGNGLIAYNAEVVSATDYYAFGSPMPGRQGIQQCSTYVDTVYVNNYIAQEDFSSSSVGGFVAGSGSRSVSNPSGNVLRIESIWTARPLATRSVAVAANTDYTVNFDIVGYSNLSNFTENVRVRIIIPGGLTITQNYTATGSHSLYIRSVTAGNITVEISQVITGSGSYGINPFVDIDNFSVTYITTTTSTSTVCSVWDKGYRFGFNSMEKDNEINVNGGSYDFGARIYDSRLGRWLSLDLLAKEFPNESGYIFAGNTPITLIDKKGYYKITPEDQKKYPVLTKYLSTNVLNDVLNSPTIMANLMTYGKLSKEQITKALTWNDGLNLSIGEIAWDAGGAYRGCGGLIPDGQPITSTAYDFFQLNVNLVTLLENAKPEDMQAALLAVVSTILHETVHYGDYKEDCVNTTTPEVINGIESSEQGEKFELKTYGKNIGDGANMSETTNWTKYIEDSKKVITEKSKTEEGKKDLPTVPAT